MIIIFEDSVNTPNSRLLKNFYYRKKILFSDEYNSNAY